MDVEFKDDIANGYGVLYLDSNESKIILKGYWQDGDYIGIKAVIHLINLWFYKNNIFNEL